MRTRSILCQSCVSLAAGSVREISPEEVAWLAGLIEGEGSFVATTRTLSVHMTDEDVIRRLQEVTGVGRVYATAKQKPRHKDAYKWHVKRRDHLRQLVPLLLPWLGARRRKAATALLESL